MEQETEIVLVHGLWHQPAHFDELARALRARGVSVRAPRLHRGSLAADTAAVQQVVDACQSPPVVLGHSYGGTVVTGLQRIRHLVYVAAFVPNEGESGALLGGTDALVNAAIQHNDDGTTSIRSEMARKVLYADCSEEDSARATALLVPQRSGHGRGVPGRIAWHSTASTYILCEGDKALDPVVQGRMAARCTSAVSISAGHSPFISQPADIARIILEELPAVADGPNGAPKQTTHAEAAADELVRTAYSARAVEYTNLLGFIDDMHELDRRRIERWASGISGPVLDAGCGPGHWTDFLHRLGIDISGVDLVPEFIGSARRRFPDVPFRVASLGDLDVPDGSMVGVLAWYSLIHTPPLQLRAVLAELHRVLEPQGRLLVGFFQGESGRTFAHAVTPAYYWSIDGMTSMLQEAGFEVLEAETRRDPGQRPHAAMAAVSRGIRTSNDLKPSAAGYRDGCCSVAGTDCETRLY